MVTHTFENPLQRKDDRVEVIPNINLEKLDDTLKLIEGQVDYVVHSGKICHPSNVSTDFQVVLNQTKTMTNVLEAIL